ncbi:iron-siderophore ABC transporter substrate-binding protein [Gloeocapsopsis dulcis]|uniref:Amino acid ABC transporter substrate-binding protein n=1 Tax=Gloeocapsopsis dulcis AAB1 = 1H9 TaxID=1433147 RepID=A0A6N8FY15_9CHRO|nr:iron-siderophore ABC transporter substrate-binding protein [Gloeocapsopsis dulcis]MUL37729.1 amino acid ABC transporter substrate-binding protein [Gloeocapsopsis dulcis AAB1 = 1H9]WNN88441.1 iron-siderophore ABC transporter substrate-binding protein [Gloeocapsopsis dulcis]
MLYRTCRRLRYGLLTILAIALIAACTSNAPVAVDADCYIVQHFAGETCVPRQPKRVVALDSITLEYLLSLGIRPIGAVSSDLVASDLHHDLTGIANIGSTDEPNLEKIVSLQPDLIVGTDYYQTIYAQSTQIAPTVLYEFEHSGKWKEILLHFAQMLQKSEVAEQVMNNYQMRLEKFKQQMGHLQNTEVSVVRIYPNSINLYLKDSFCGTILQDAGLPRPPAQTIAADEAQKQFGNPIQTSISRELLAQADGDVMFMWTGENTVEANQQAQQRLLQLKSDPLWQKMRVVQQNKIYQVPSYWLGSGPIAANLVIDDLFKYLIDR